ncbi:MAG TPA: AsmA-like C-terminal region-containing protein [Anaeromyxobacter sp.]|nr:AsmA-like C-terminal region-containing protein [Anaeromyxobacter sp.]
MSKPGKRRWPKVLAIVAGTLVVLVIVGVLILDRVLLRVANDQAAKLSTELQRPIAIEGVATRLWGGLGAKVTGLSIGAGPGESLPLLQLQRAEVSPYLWRALKSGGEEIAIHEAVVEGLRVNVEKLPDGTTNLERLAKRLEERSKAEPEPAQEPAQEGAAKPPPSLEIGRAAVENARIAFLDRTVEGAKELFVEDLDAEVRDLKVGEPVELRVKAAVLAAQQNLDLTVRAAPLPASLVPTPEKIVLKVQPIDLGPLAPFVPRSVGLQGGRFQADLDADLGAAVPGGEGQTKVVGGFRATDLAFAGQAAGKRLDASLAADVTADVKAGDLDLRKLELIAGPAALVGTGRASGLRGQTPKVEGLEITSRGLDPAAVTELFPALRKQMGGAVVAGPIGLSLRGSGSAAAQRLELRVDLGPVRLAIPRQLEKAAGAPMTLVATADAEQGGRVRFDADADLAGVDLRPGGALAKKPGDALSMRVSGALAQPGGGVDVTLSRLALNVLGDTLAGKGRVSMAGQGRSKTTKFDAELAGERLDLDRLLVAAPEERKKEEKEEPASKPDPSAFAGLSGEARLRLGLLRMKRVEARNVLARVRVKEDQVTLEQAQLQAFGGSVDAAGTTMRLAHPDEPFKVVTKLQGVSAEQALGLLGDRKLLSGTLDLDLNLNGPGLDKASLLKQLTGILQGEIRGGQFHGKDLVSSVAGPLASKLPFAKKPAEGNTTSLGKELPFNLQIKDGVAQLSKPLRFDAGQGEVELTGGIGLDGSLRLPATVALTPDFVARLTGGRVKPDAPVPLTFRLAGAATSPRVEGLSVDAAAKALASQAATGAIGKALGLGGGEGDAGKDGAKQGDKPDAKKQLEQEAAKRLKGLFGK